MSIICMKLLEDCCRRALVLMMMMKTWRPNVKMPEAVQIVHNEGSVFSGR